jgi:hypothetical protein
MGVLIVVIYDNGGTFPGMGALIVVFYDNGETFPGMIVLKRSVVTRLCRRSLKNGFELFYFHGSSAS